MSLNKLLLNLAEREQEIRRLKLVHAQRELVCHSVEYQNLLDTQMSHEKYVIRLPLVICIIEVAKEGPRSESGRSARRAPVGTSQVSDVNF